MKLRKAFYGPRAKAYVRSGVRTHARIRGPEFSPATSGKVHLESGALDHSAILTGGANRIKTPYSPCK